MNSISDGGSSYNIWNNPSANPSANPSVASSNNKDYENPENQRNHKVHHYPIITIQSSSNERMKENQSFGIAGEQDDIMDDS